MRRRRCNATYPIFAAVLGRPVVKSSHRLADGVCGRRVVSARDRQVPMNPQRSQRGIALVELLVFFVVASLLAGLVLIGLGLPSNAKQDELTACEADEYTLLAAVDSYHWQVEKEGRPTERDLVMAGFLPSTLDGADLRYEAGKPRAISSGDCK